MEPHIKDAVYRLTNLLQLVLSHIEMENYKRAFEAARDAAKELKVLTRMLHSMTNIPADRVSLLIPKEATIVVPIDSKVTALDEMDRAKVVVPQDIAKVMNIVTSDTVNEVKIITPPAEPLEVLSDGIAVKIIPPTPETEDN